MQEDFKIPHVPFTSFKKNLRVGGKVLVKNYLKTISMRGISLESKVMVFGFGDLTLKTGYFKKK